MSLVQYLSRSVLEGLYPACCSAASSSTTDDRSSAVDSLTHRYAALDALTGFFGATAAAAATAGLDAAFLGDGIREGPPDDGIASS